MTKLNEVDELKQRLVDVWDGLVRKRRGQLNIDK